MLRSLWKSVGIAFLQKCRLPQGKIHGGSSKLNNMIHIRGNIDHYVNWFHGKHTKGYITNQLQYIEDEILHLGSIQYESDLSDAILKGAEELGYKINDKHFQEGFAKSKVSQKNGKRWTTSDKLLSKYVVTNVFVESIIFKGNVACGVNVQINNKKIKINARKMVILSAGTINTPKILQLSGIGPGKILKPLNIPIIKELPVGKNLQDHVATGIDLVLFNKSVSIDAFDMINPVNALQYFINGKGPLTTSGCEVVGFVSSTKQKEPDLQFMVLPVGLSSDRGSLFRKSLGVKDDVWHKYFAKTFDKFVASIIPIVLHPKSKGEVFIENKDSGISPVFDPKYLSNKNDIDALVKGLKIVKKLVETSALKNIGAYLNPYHFPGCESHEMFSDSYLECYVRHLTLTSYHPVGTCSMGLPDTRNAVVDLSFKVIGVERLFVADASVLPTLPSGNINAAIAMMASVFFDTNISSGKSRDGNDSYCKNLNIFYEELWNVCIAS